MRIMGINNTNNRTKQQNFESAKDGKNFRRIANNLILTLKRTTSASDYTTRVNNSTPSLQTRLSEAIYTKALNIGKEFVTPEDRRLHEKLKELKIMFDETDDYLEAMGAMCLGAERHYQPHSIDFTI